MKTMSRIAAVLLAACACSPADASFSHGLAFAAPPHAAIAPSINSLSESSGNIADHVIITGARLDTVMTVAFNGTSASFVTDSSTQITATVPEGATTGPITAEAPTGIGTSSTFTISTGTMNASLSMAYAPAGPVGTPITMALDVWIPPDVTSVTLHVSNADVTAATTTIAACPGVDFGFGTSNGSLGYSGSPTTVTNQTIPANGAYLTVGPVSVTRGSDGKIIVAYTIPGACAFQGTGVGVTWGGRNVGTGSVDPLPSLSANNSIGYTMFLSYTTAHRRLYVLGDSLGVGYSTTPYPVSVPDSAWYKLGPDHGYAVDASGIPGATLTQWQDTTNRPYYTNHQSWSGAHCFIEASINDLVLGYNATQYRTHIEDQASWLIGQGCKRVYSMTVTPSTAYAAQDSTRQTWNTAALSGFTGVDFVVDADTLLRKPSDHTVLDTVNDSGDGTHYSVAGHSSLSTEIATDIATY